MVLNTCIWYASVQYLFKDAHTHIVMILFVFDAHAHVRYNFSCMWVCATKLKVEKLITNVIWWCDLRKLDGQGIRLVVWCSYESKNKPSHLSVNLRQKRKTFKIVVCHRLLSHNFSLKWIFVQLVELRTIDWSSKKSVRILIGMTPAWSNCSCRSFSLTPKCAVVLLLRPR